MGKLTNKNSVLATRLTPEMYAMFKKLASRYGLKPSQYLRRLVLSDLERKGFVPKKD